MTAHTNWRSRLASIGAVICLIYIIVMLAERARVIPRAIPPALTAVGTALRIQQTWYMFAPDPTRATAVHDIRKTMSNGMQLTESADTSFRWTVYLGRTATNYKPDHPLGQSLRRFANLHCGVTSPNDRGHVERIALLTHRRDIDYTGHTKPTTSVLIDARCPVE
jgi:hypothetical protein